MCGQCEECLESMRNLEGVHMEPGRNVCNAFEEHVPPPPEFDQWGGGECSRGCNFFCYIFQTHRNFLPPPLSGG